jgi:hypothetical protein
MPHSLTGPNPMPRLPAAFKDQEAHEQFLSDWLNWHDHFPALAAKHGLTIDQLLDWHQSDEIQLRLKRLAEMAQSRAFYLAQLHRTTAITRLTEVVNDTRSVDPKDRVRAATQLLRLAKQADDRRPAPAVSDSVPASNPLTPHEPAAHKRHTRPPAPASRGSTDNLPHPELTNAAIARRPRDADQPSSAPTPAPRALQHAPPRTHDPRAPLHLNGQHVRRAG